jgi:hypothetical protein
MVVNGVYLERRDHPIFNDSHMVFIGMNVSLGLD